MKWLIIRGHKLPSRLWKPTGCRGIRRIHRAWIRRCTHRCRVLINRCVETRPVPSLIDIRQSRWIQRRAQNWTSRDRRYSSEERYPFNPCQTPRINLCTTPPLKINRKTLWERANSPQSRKHGSVQNSRNPCMASLALELHLLLVIFRWTLRCPWAHQRVKYQHESDKTRISRSCIFKRKTKGSNLSRPLIKVKNK